MAGMDESDPENDVMVEFDFLSPEGEEGAGEAQSPDATDWGESFSFTYTFCSKVSAPFSVFSLFDL